MSFWGGDCWSAVAVIATVSVAGTPAVVVSWMVGGVEASVFDVLEISACPFVSVAFVVGVANDVEEADWFGDIVVVINGGGASTGGVTFSAGVCSGVLKVSNLWKECIFIV
jgi:hypothetical protein